MKALCLYFSHDAICLSKFYPSPRRLYLERQFTRSVLLSWKPADLPANLVKGYGVYVNGDLRLMMNGGSKTKALLEDIDPEEVRLIVSCKLTLSQNMIVCMRVVLNWPAGDNRDFKLEDEGDYEGYI